ncbi:hypothetical protein PXH66_17735 [Synoicihabitans lomoniglobus]|uniref:STAS domain-containing protein n=1 Tax=Synoicihabitans lomoniglobus TaxID=2909285 RepID=A0AAE9ZVK0_9BACT|nr:hypothetical protein PXH66_17735 [Opitutaceae bacterium LMO-M01]
MVPTFSAQARTCRDLFTMWKHFDRDEIQVVFDFAQTHFIRSRAVAFIAGLIRLIENRGGAVRFKWDTLSSAVAAQLAHNGFMPAFGSRQLHPLRKPS